MEFNIEIRKKQLKSLKQYIKSSEDNVQSVLQCLGWSSRKTLEKEDPKVICPVNKNHLILYKTSDKHLGKCTIHCSGYDMNEEYLSEPPEASKQTIKLNTAKKIEILSVAKSSKSDFKSAWNGRGSDPMTANRLVSTFSPDERSALYDYCIKHTESPPKPDEFTVDLPEPKDKKELSEAEKLILERDAKRRRAKYKSVHTSKKNQTEIMREVIDNQMTLYTQWIEHKQEQEKRDKDKLEKIKKEKNKQNQIEQSTAYNYIETTYNQTNVNQPNENNVQWDQFMQYSENYSGQYYSNIQTTQGIITDWSHVYQGAVDTDIYADSDQYPVESGEYVEQTEQTKSSADATSTSYAENSKLSNLYPSSQVHNGHSHEGSISKKPDRVVNKGSSELKFPYDKNDSRKTTYRSRSREKDRRHEKESRRQRSRERRKDRRH